MKGNYLQLIMSKLANKMLDNRDLKLNYVVCLGYCGDVNILEAVKAIISYYLNEFHVNNYAVPQAY